MSPATHYADVRINVRVYFADNKLDALRDQAMEAVDSYVGPPDLMGECELNGVEITRVFDVLDNEVFP